MNDFQKIVQFILFQAMKEQIQQQIKLLMILTLEDFQEKIKVTIVRFYLFQSMEEHQQRQQTLVI